MKEIYDFGIALEKFIFVAKNLVVKLNNISNREKISFNNSESSVEM